MKLKCISDKLNTVAFDENKKPRRVKVGDTFRIGAKKIPKKWEGLVTEVSDDGDAKTAVTNPANDGEPKTSNGATTPTGTQTAAATKQDTSAPKAPTPSAPKSPTPAPKQDAGAPKQDASTKK